jgi:hypothetical protein
MPEPACLNLRNLFGEEYRITFDPAYNSAQVPREKLDPWYMQIRGKGKGVTIYPFGGSKLCVECDNRPGIVKQLVALGLLVWQDGSTDKTFQFDLAEFEQVAAIVQPRKRRQMTPEQRAKLAERGREALEHYREANAQSGN